MNVGIWGWYDTAKSWVKAAVDSLGHLQVDVLEAALPTDAAKDTTLDAGLVALVTKFLRSAKAAQHGVAETANTDILASALTPTDPPCLFRTMVMLETAGVFSAMLSDGIVTKTLKLNGGTALTANCVYILDVLVHSGDTVNFQTSVSGNVTLRVQEIVAGVQ